MAKYNRYDPRNKKKDKQKNRYLERTPVRNKTISRNKGLEIDLVIMDEMTGTTK